MRCLRYALLLVGAAAIQCPGGDWYEFSGSCYSKQEPGSHFECATICGRSNASLAHIESEQENNFVRYFVPTAGLAWIGYFKVMNPIGDNEGFWGFWTSSVEDQEYT